MEPHPALHPRCHRCCTGAVGASRWPEMETRRFEGEVQRLNSKPVLLASPLSISTKSAGNCNPNGFLRYPSLSHLVYMVFQQAGLHRVKRTKAGLQSGSVGKGNRSLKRLHDYCLDVLYHKSKTIHIPSWRYCLIISGSSIFSL